MEEQEEGIFAEINKHNEATNNKGKIVEMKVVENKTENRPNDNDSVGVEEKEYTVYDLFNLLNELKTKMDKGSDMINKHFNEREETMNKHFDNMNKGFDELHIELDKTKEIMSKGCDTKMCIRDRWYESVRFLGVGISYGEVH